MSNEFVTLKIRRRPWYEWVIWAVWLFMLVFIFQNAAASGAELEPRAATIFWVSFVVWLLGGAVVWFIRSNKRKPAAE